MFLRSGFLMQGIKHSLGQLQLLRKAVKSNMVKFFLGKGVQVQKTDEQEQQFAFDMIQNQKAMKLKWHDHRKILVI